MVVIPPRCSGLLAFALTTLLSARATTQTPHCRTVTWRPEASIVTAATPTSSALISLRRGERLCLLATWEEATGALSTLRVSPASAPPFLEVSLARAGANTVLRINNRLSSSIAFDLDLQRESGFSRTHSIVAAPTSVSLASWEGEIAELRLSRVRTVDSTVVAPDPGPVALDRPGPPPPVFLKPSNDESWLAVVLATRIQRANVSRALAQELQRHGYSSLPSNLPLWGLAFEFNGPRLRNTWELLFAGSGKYTRQSDREAFSASCLSFGWHVGYQVLRYQGLSLTPAAGLEGGSFRISVDPTTPPFLEDQLRSQPEDTRVSFAYGAALASIALDDVVPLGRFRQADYGLLLGVRVGYLQQFARGSWGQGDQDLPDLERGSERSTLSGPFLRFALGLAESPLR